MPTPTLQLLVSAIKTALKSAEGGTLSRKQLRREVEPQLDDSCGDDKSARKEVFGAALQSLLERGRVSVEGAVVKWSKRGEKRPLPDTPVETQEAPVAEAKAKGADSEAPPCRKRAKVETDLIPAAVTSAGEEYRKANLITVVGKSDVLPDPFQSFDAALEAFGAPVVDALRSAGFKAPSPIQAQAWPVAISGGDLVAVAKTGSGKTLAFALPVLRSLRKRGKSGNGVQALVLAPTRELATQIEEVVAKYGPIFGVSCACVYGGVPKGPQIKALRSSPGLLVATPGRMVDLLQDKATVLSNTHTVVLDEADRMLDMGFQPQISALFEQMPGPGQKQVLFFTATWPKGVQKMAKNYLGAEFVHLNIGSTEELAANTAITQVFHKLDDSEKDDALRRELIKMGDDAKVVIFTNTKRRADNISKVVWEDGYGCASIHGDKSQMDREKALKAFKSGEWPVLVATDVAARGLDIDSVTHVVNFDMPRDVEGYVHRIGRTGRAGKSGASITFWNPDYDTECAPALAKIARDAGQPVPEWLAKVADKLGKGKKNWAVDKIAQC